jgi:integrase
LSYALKGKLPAGLCLIIIGTEGVDHLLPQQPGKRERVSHQPSMPWRDIPDFVQNVLRASAANVTRALLEFVILTAARSGEARAMTWDRS